MPVRQSHLTLLRPFLVGESPRENGEVDMYCPLHEDSKRSASLNVKEGVWYCNACEVGGRVAQLVRERSRWVDPTAVPRNGGSTTRGGAVSRPAEALSEAAVQGWVAALHASEAALVALQQARGLNDETISQYDIGWDSSKGVYTIPVRDESGALVNVRRYNLNPPEGRRKIWGIPGHNDPRLFPVEALAGNPRSVIICGGEWDALITLQNHYTAITRTAAEKVWDTSWNSYFAGKVVYLCHDMDETGQAANRKIGEMVRGTAKEVRVLKLPYKVTKKHGKDLSDFWQEHTREEFQELLEQAEPFDKPPEPEDLDPHDATVLDSFDSRRVGKPLRLVVTIKGKREPGYSVPRKVKYTCTQDAGEKCLLCPMNSVGGEDEILVEPEEPVVLEMIGSNQQQVGDALRRHYGAQKCSRLVMDVRDFQAVEQLFARPSVDHVNGAGDGDYKNMKITSVGRHDTMPNNTVRVVGSLFPEPRTQANEFQVWEVAKQETSLDTFELDEHTAQMLRRFRPKPGQRPLSKMADIAKEMAAHVTHIYGRNEMHALMDLVYHSVLHFDFAGQRVQRGWLQALVLGDTRTGKSEVASRLRYHYRAGEMVSCEAASFAGIIGGLQQFNSKEWSVSWGTVPLNDRRLVVLDEISGLHPDEIGAMSDVRSRGVAQLTKIGTNSEQTHARARMIWLGNPRGARMQDYTYGVQAIRPLIGSNEDVARFDMAMSVAAGEVPPDQFNRPPTSGRLAYTTEVASALVRWVWSRTPDQVVWAPGAEEAVYRAASRMGNRYVEDPPLVQGADIRIKIARISVAMAARLFSTADEDRAVLVKRQHVRDAVAFVDRLYNMEGFGYAERSRELIGDRKAAEEARHDVQQYLFARKGLAKFLRNAGSFRRQDLEEMLNVDRETANGIINTLYGARMVRKEKGDIKVEPTLHTLLRKVRR